MSGMNRGGALGDLDEACRSLKTHAGRREHRGAAGVVREAS